MPLFIVRALPPQLVDHQRDRCQASLRAVGEIRPTSIAKVKLARYWRSRIDPFAAVAADLDRRFSASPASTGREIFEALQAEHPGIYADHLLRTFQRRIKLWRHGYAKSLVFGAVHHGRNPADILSMEHDPSRPGPS